MSDNEQAPLTSEAQNQSRTASTSTGEARGRDNDGGEIQSETIGRLNQIVSDYIAQRVTMHEGCRLLASALNDNAILTDEQRAETYNRFGERLEQAAATRARAIARGERERNQPPGPEPFGEDEPGQSNTDDQARPPAQVLPQSNPNPLSLGSRSDPQGSALKRTGDEEGNERGDYAWNWKKLGGGPPWRDDEEATLSTVDKTYLLRNVYTVNIKRALQSLESQRGVPDFPPVLWRDVLANRQVDFGVLAEDRHSRTTVYDNVIDLGDNVELTTKAGTKSKTKVTNDSQWNYAWTKYSEAVLFAYPHRKDELFKYGRHILGRFLSNLDTLLNIEYDLAARKFFHGHQDLSFADLDELSALSFEIFLPQSQRGGSWGNDKSIAGSSQGSRRGKNKRKHTGSASEYPVCRDFNRSSGCKRTDCRFLHKCSNCSSSSHPECRCPRKSKEEVHE